MDKLFKLFKKSTKVENNPFHESPDNQQELKEETSEQLGLMSAIRRYAPPSIKNLLFSIGLFYAVEEAGNVISKVADRQYISLENEGPHLRSVYKNILAPEEYVKFDQYLKSNTPYFLTDEDYRNNINTIAQDFPITASELVSLNDIRMMDNVDSLTHQEDLVRALAEIKAAEKEGYDAGFSIVPVKNISILRDRDYVENMKKLVSLGFERIGSNPRMLKPAMEADLRKISKLAPNIRFDGSILYYRENLVINEELAHIKENLNNSYITSSFMHSLASPDRSTNRWNEFFSDAKNKAMFSILQHEGYGISSFETLGYQQESIDSFFQNPGNINFLINLTKHVNKGDLNKREVTDLLYFCKEYYTHGKYDSLNNILPDIIEVTKNEKILSLDEIITRLSKLGLYQNIYLPLIQETPKEQRLEDEFFQDYALTYVRKLGYHKKPPAILAGMNSRDQAAWILQTCRLMVTTDVECTETAFTTALQSIMETRSNPEILNTPLFSDRVVAMMAHNEKYDSYEAENPDSRSSSRVSILRPTKVPRFGKDSLVASIKDQHPKDFKLFRASENLENLSTKKKAFIDFIKTNKRVTIFIDAHGSSDAVSFTEGLPDDAGVVQGQELSNAVYAKEIAEALIERYNAGITDRAILIDNACMNFEFIKNVYRIMYYSNEKHHQNVPLPMAVGMSEMGQYGFSTFQSDYGSMFSENLLKGSGNKQINMLDVLEVERDGKGMLSNISVFIPQKADVEKWILKNKKKKDVDESDFEKKKVKVEVPFQIAENEILPDENLEDLRT